MQKNNLPQNYIQTTSRVEKGIWPGRRMFIVKLVFGGIIAGGLIVVGPGARKQNALLQDPAEVYASKQQNTLNPPALKAAYPKLLEIPKLKISAPFEFLGLNLDHTIEVPKNSMSVGWFMYGSRPGEVGATVIVGHLDSALGPAVFANLEKIKPGEKIYIELVDGSVVTYRVDSIAKFSQDNFPTEEIYGRVSYSAIRLITCAGSYSKKAGHYSENLVVFGTKM